MNFSLPFAPATFLRGSWIVRRKNSATSLRATLLFKPIEFLNLSRYAEEEITTDARRQQKFHRGLNPDLRLALAVHEFANFATMVNKAITVEFAQMEHKNSLKRYHDVGSSSGVTQKRRIWLPTSVTHSAVPAPRPSYAAPRLPPPPQMPRALPAPPIHQGPEYLGFRPADGLSVEFGRWAMKCWIASVERSLTR